MSFDVEKSPADAAAAASKSKLPRLDSLHQDADKVSGKKYHDGEDNLLRTLRLAFQSIGIVYGDIGTSPLYVYSGTFPNGIKHKDDILGALSLIIYTLILIPLIKYVFIVLRANDNGDGGTFALYSKISRYAKVSLIPNQQAEDALVSNYNLELPSAPLRRAQWIREKLQTSKLAKVFLFFLTILGTSMVMGEGTLTPSISVLSAVSGIREKAPNLGQDAVVWISVAILFCLFSVQRFGTDKVGYTFAPIIMIWFVLIAGIGLYNIVKFETSVLRAFNPKYIGDYFRRNGKDAWVSLGGIILCITGTEAMFADLGHFNVRAIQISFCFVLFPAVTLTYIGQAAYLWRNPDDVLDTFYKAIPGPLFWPAFIVAIAASIIASQAMLSGAFQIIAKALTLGAFPRVTVTHTSKKYEGQVYIPEINFLIGLASIVVTLIFRTTNSIGNAYGICVLCVMSMTTHLMTVVMLLIWKLNVVLVVLFYVVFASTEFLYLSSNLNKFIDGGYLPFAFSMVLMATMAIWHYVHVKKYWFELDHIVTADKLVEVFQRRDVRRNPGVGLLYSELVQGIPPVLVRLVEKIPSIQAVFVIVSIKHLPIPHVGAAERFVFRQAQPAEYRMYRCVARYGYTDAQEDASEFAAYLIDRLQWYIQEESLFINNDRPALTEDPDEQEAGTDSALTPATDNAAAVAAAAVAAEDGKFIQREVANGVVYMLAEVDVVAKPRSSLGKKAVIAVYNFLRKNLREGDKALLIPKNQLLKIGITYEI